MAEQSVLWVEGKDDQHVVWSLLEHHRVPQVFRVRDLQGIASLLEALPVQLAKGSAVSRVGIVVDADTDVSARWDAIRGILARSGYRELPQHPSPEGTIVHQDERPTFGAWLMPGNATPGMLEDFAAALVPAGDFLWTHAADVLNGIPDEHRRFAAAHSPKAHVRTWLAWQEDPGAPIGLAITKRYLDAEAPSAQRFVAWIRRLFLDDASE